MGKEFSIIKKSIPQEIKDLGTIKVRTDLIHPVVWLYTTIYYKYILVDIHEIGRNYAQIDTLIEFYKGMISETTLRRMLKEMEQLELIKIISDKQRSYVVLQKNALIYLTEKINNWNPRLPNEIQLNKSNCLFRKAKEYEGCILFDKSIQRIMNINQLMFGLKMDLGLKEVNHFNVNQFEAEHCYIVYGYDDEEKWNLHFLILDLGKASKLALLLKIHKIIEEIRRCMYSVYNRSDQNHEILEDLLIHIEVMTYSQLKNEMLDTYFKNALSGNLPSDDKKRIEEETLEEFDLHEIAKAIVFGYEVI